MQELYRCKLVCDADTLLAFNPSVPCSLLEFHGCLFKIFLALPFITCAPKAGIGLLFLMGNNLFALCPKGDGEEGFPGPPGRPGDPGDRVSF